MLFGASRRFLCGATPPNYSYAADGVRLYALAMAACAFHLSVAFQLPAASQESLQPIHIYYEQSTLVAVVRITEGRVTDGGCGAVYAAAVERPIKGLDVSTVRFHDNAGLQIHGRYLIFLAASDSDFSSVFDDEYSKAAYKDVRAKCIEPEVPLTALPVQGVSVGRARGSAGVGRLTADANIMDVDTGQLRGTNVRREEHDGIWAAYRVDLDALIEYMKNGSDGP